MNILVIAPTNPTLPDIDAEIAAITANHETTLVIGTVRDTDITQAIRLNAPFQVIWWITHGGSEGVELSNGVILNIDGVGQFVASSQAGLCVLNSCSSEDAARQIVIGGEASIIYTISNLPDAEATRFGALLAIKLTETDDFRIAFERAKPLKGEYRMLDAGVALRSMDLTISGRVDKLVDRVDINTQNIYELKVDARANLLTTDALRASVDVIRTTGVGVTAPMHETLIRWLSVVSVLQLILVLAVFWLALEHLR